MKDVLDRTVGSGGTSADQVLRNISRAEPGRSLWSQPQWRQEYERMQAALAEKRDTALVPDLLRLARAQGETCAGYLALVETCLHSHAGDPVALEQIWQELRGSYTFLRACLSSSGSLDSRKLAARLLAAFSDENGQNASALDWALRRERDADMQTALLAGLHALRRTRPDWPGTLLQFLTPLNAPDLRFQAACCHLDSAAGATAQTIKELAEQLYYGDGHAHPSVRAIALYAARLDRPSAVALWSGLLGAAEEFDGAAEIACQLLRAATEDRREGWNRVRLTTRKSNGEPSPPPGMMVSAVRLAYAGLYQKITGRKASLGLPPGQVPAREYPDVRAFPPALSAQDPLVRRVLQQMAECDPLWLGQTEMWRLFGLPERRLELRLLVDAV